MDCTADGGSPDVVNIYAIYRDEKLNLSRQLDYLLAKASSQFDLPDRSGLILRLYIV